MYWFAYLSASGKWFCRMFHNRDNAVAYADLHAGWKVEIRYNIPGY